MADTIRTRADLVTILADNVTGDISPQDIRDFLVSCILRNTGSGADQYIIKPQTGDSTTFFQIQEYDAGDIIFNVDTTNKKVGIKTATPATYCEMLSPISNNSYDANSAFQITTSQATPRRLIMGLGGSDTGFFGMLSNHGMDIATNSSPRIRITAAGLVGIGNIVPTNLFDINDDSLRIRTTQSPASNASGNAGEIAWDASYLYVCTATNTWERAELTGGY